MSAAVKRNAEDHKAPPPAKTYLEVASSGVQAHPSPARALQTTLHASISEVFPEPVVEKLPGAVRFGVLLTLCGSTWTGLILLARLL